MPGLYSRLKNWIQDEKLLYSDLNAEFNNIIENSEAQYLGGYANTDGQYKQQVSPPGATINASIADEITWLRSQLATIIGGTYWYEAPAASISQIWTALGGGASGVKSKVISGAVNADEQPIYLEAQAGSKQVKLKGSVTPFNFQADGTVYTISTDITSNVAASPLTDTIPVGFATPSVDDDFKVLISLAPVAAPVPAAILALEGQTVAMKSGTAVITGKLTRSSETGADYIYLHAAKQGSSYFDSTQTPLAVGAAGASIAMLTYGYVFVDASSTLTVTQYHPVISGTAPTDTNPYWFDVANGVWKKYNGSAWVTAQACLVGIALFDATSCVGVRSVDFAANYTAQSNVYMIKKNDSSSLSTESGVSVNVYGKEVNFPAPLIWTLATDLDTGSLANTTQYYLYIKKDGTPKFSVTVPTNRQRDLFGLYHPNKPWRAVGSFFLQSTAPLSYQLYPNVFGEVANDNARDLSIQPRKLLTVSKVATITSAGGSLNIAGGPTLMATFSFLNQARPVLVNLQNCMITNPNGTYGNIAVTADYENVVGQFQAGKSIGITNTAQFPPFLIIPPVGRVGEVVVYKVYGTNINIDSQAFTAGFGAQAAQVRIAYM